MSAELIDLVADTPPLLRALLVERFGNTRLAYHNLDHIRHMLDNMGAWGPLPDRDARILRYAIWLHDVFYDVAASDNERRSADIGLALLQWPEDELRDLEACIIATEGHATDHPLAQMLVDLDLAILAEPRAGYRAYALAIRDEYRRYPDETYRAGRIRVLDGLGKVPLLRRLSRARGLAEDALELVARANMRWEQDRLRSDAPTVEAALAG